MRKAITFDELTISYLEKNEAAAHSIFFIHGNSGAATFWQPQLDDAYLEDYRLIAFDLPAHGQSSADPHQNYGVLDLGKTMAKAVKSLAKEDSFILVGVSMGTNILAEMLREPINPKGAVLAGSTIVGDEYSFQNIGLPDVDPGVVFRDQASESELENYYAQILYTKNDSTVRALVADHQNVKVPFRSTIIRKAMEGQISNELELLRDKGFPVLIVYGNYERVIEPGYLERADLSKWNNQVYRIQDAGHLVSLEQPQAFNELLRAYAKERFTGSLYSGRSESAPMRS